MTIQAIVLAAGQGTRMNHPDLPKVLVPVNGRPMITYVLDTLSDIGIPDPVIVIKHKAEKVRETLGARRFVEQDERVGTGAAVQATSGELRSHEGLIYIVNGDHPFFSVETYQALATAQENPQVAIALATSQVSSIEERYGRIVRSSDATVERIVEYKDATDAERQLTEYNAGLYLVRSPWLWSALDRIEPSGVTGEYYLTDIVALAIADGYQVAAVGVHRPSEAHGINTPEELAIAEQLLKERV